MKNFIPVLFSIVFTFFSATGQVNNIVPTKILAGDFKKLVELNSHLEHVIDLSGKEAGNIMDNATVSQIIEITTPYINSGIINTKSLCWSMFAHALLQKPINQNQKREIVEILCKNYLSNETDLQTADNTLLKMKAADFSATSRKYIAALIDTIPKYFYSICATLLATAQIKESIPVLWKIAKKDIGSLEQSDLDVLASLARMNEKEAGIILCNYYNSKRNNKDYQHVFLAKHLAFSLDKNVFDCMVADFKTIDTAINFREGDSGYNPSHYLGICIAGMLKEYPYPDKDYLVRPKQLIDWLSQPGNNQLKEK